MIEAQPIDDALTFLLEHLPPQMHLVIATREDPHLPLARLRVRGQLTELRATDLRFTPSEAAEFLNQVMGLNLSARTSPRWKPAPKAGLPGCNWPPLPARHSPCRGEKTSPALSRLSPADHRYVVDYLVEEVLQRQPERVRSFLLQTSILDRLSGPLCDAVDSTNAHRRKIGSRADAGGPGAWQPVCRSAR